MIVNAYYKSYYLKRVKPQGKFTLNSPCIFLSNDKCSYEENFKKIVQMGVSTAGKKNLHKTNSIGNFDIFCKYKGILNFETKPNSVQKWGSKCFYI